MCAHTPLPCLLCTGGEYFSDEQMRFRAPLLYEQYIGQYLTQEELSARTPAPQAPRSGSPGTPAYPLSDLLFQSYQERELQQKLLRQQEEEEACFEEEEDSDEEGEGRVCSPTLCHPAGPPLCHLLLIAVVQAPEHSIAIVSNVCARRAETGVS